MGVDERTFRVMASAAQVLVIDGGDELANMAQLHLEHLERRWSRFIATSDISRMNTGAGGPVAVAPETLVLVTAMIEAWHLTGRRFDPTTLPALIAAGYATSISDPQRTTVLPEGTCVGGDLQQIIIDADASTVALPVGLALDPGGLGKGLAADLTAEMLLGRGAAGALVSIGGDLVAVGQPPGLEGWVVAVEDPWDDDHDLLALAIEHGAVATSSTRTRRWTHEGRSRHHLIDPASGLEAQTDLVAVTVTAPTGWEAEALATAALLTGSDGAIEFLTGHDAEGFAFTNARQVLSTFDDVAAEPILSQPNRSR